MVFLKAEPKNAYDPNAVGIFNAKGQQLGYIQKDTAKLVSPGLLAGGQSEAHVDKVTGGNGKAAWGCNLSIRLWSNK